MHSRKSIFYRGIVFIASIFAMAIFSQVNIKAASDCKMILADNNAYLTFGGSNSNWSDSELAYSGTCTSEERGTYKKEGVYVNGSQVSSFVPSNYGPGHYTIEYKYELLSQKHSTYRYVRILDANFDTSKNYNLGAFNAFTADADDNVNAQIVNAFYDSDSKNIVNFIVSNDATYVVVTNLVGKELAREKIDYSIGLNNHGIKLKDVLRRDKKYYLIGNIDLSATSQGGVVKAVNVNDATISVDLSIDAKRDGVTYNSGYLSSATAIYLVGKDSSGKPIIDLYATATIQSVHTHGIEGEYNSVIVKGDYIYAVGYELSGTSTSKGLYTYTKKDGSTTGKNVKLFDEDAKFTKIISSDSGKNIIIGETHALQISAGGTISAINTRAGYSDALVLELDNEANMYHHAGLYGSSTNDIFTNIVHLGGNKYALTGTASDGANSLSYTIDISTFEVSENIVSRSSSYALNGAVNTPYGPSYYGKITKNNAQVVDVYYLKEITISDPMLLVLDNRGFLNEYSASLTNETINLVRVDSPSEVHYKYCYYKVTYNSSIVRPTSCEGTTDSSGAYIPSSVITEVGIGALLEYHITTDTGAKIVLYRTVMITGAPVPIDLIDGKTGILKWYTYSRSYAYVASTAVRLDPGKTEYELVQNGVSTTVSYDFDFSYYFTGNAYAEKDIYDMISYYFNVGNTTGYNMEHIDPSNANAKKFEHSDQLSAAFGSIEYAKMYAYYQEFSRVVRVNGNVPRETLGASLYSGQYIPSGANYYIYYIDYVGNSSTSNSVDACRVTSTTVSNCSGKAGYAFADLKSINSVIKDFLNYNNYFVSTRNTIYNGSIPSSDVDEYKQELYTKEYLTSYQEVIRTATTNLTINVYDLGKGDGSVRTEVYTGTKKNVYFGGRYVSSSLVEIEGEENPVAVYTYLYNGSTYTDLRAFTDGNGNILYYYNASSVFISKNTCYEVYYSYGTGADLVKGRAKTFFLDNTAPTIAYNVPTIGDKEHNYTSQRGNSADTPAYIAKDFDINNIIDIDDYAYIMVNKVVYPITCNSNSLTCMADRDKYVYQSFRYNKSNPTKVNSITFADRSGNSITFYFVVGTNAPSLVVTDLVKENRGTVDEPEMVTTSFSLTINFYETNSIKDFMITSLARQSCSVVDSADPCYDEENDETIFAQDSNAAREFNEMVTNYIYAVSYRDRENIDGTVVLTPDAAGLYANPINSYTYKVENGYFVEVAGYEEKFGLTNATYQKEGETFYLENNFFVRNNLIYYYNDGGIIQGKEMKLNYGQLATKPDDWDLHYANYYYHNGTAYVLNSNPEFTSGLFFERTIEYTDKGEPIVLSNTNQFKFASSEQRRYQLVISQDEGTYIQALPMSYQIEADNTFRIDYNDSNGRIIYQYNPTNGLIEYANPLILTSKRIEIIFTRTTKTIDGIVSGGVDIPYTVPKYKEGTQTIEVDPLTGLEIYTIDETLGTKHFNIVDGIYDFNITQGLDFGAIKPVSASLYVTQLDLKIGYSVAHPGVLTPTDGNYTFDGITGHPFDFTGTVASATQLTSFSEDNVYPLGSSKVPEISGYEKTYFSPNSVFAGFTVKTNIVFTIRVYNSKNDYGLPYAETVCKEILILGSAFSIDDPLPTNSVCTSSSRVVMYLPENSDDTGSIDYAVLKEYGIYEVLTGGGAYIFSGLNTFYEISVVETKMTASGYVNATAVLTETFYIDNSFNENTIDAKVSTVSTDGGNLTFTNNALYSFTKIGGEYVLTSTNSQTTIGGASNVHFDLNYYTAQNTTDARENRLLMMHIVVDTTPYLCNVAKALSDDNYANECSKGYVNTTLSEDKSGTSRLIFSSSGNYTVIFQDASGNQEIYKFTIDKSAPTITLNAVDDGMVSFIPNDDGDAYLVGAYTKDPKLTIRIEDGLSSVNSYCYTFTYGNSVSIPDICPAIATNQFELITEIQMSATPSGTQLMETLAGLPYDGNVTVSISAQDALGNVTIKDIEINFWADYVPPTYIEDGTGNVNKTYVTNEEINDANVRERTITVISNDYVGKTFTCDTLNGFKFLDPRYITTDPAYTYILRCDDIHNATDPTIKAFDNTITMLFYEVEVDGFNKSIKMKDGSPVNFQFGVPTTGGDARWIYVTMMDSVGNINPNGEYLPIIVEDGISPYVVENGIKKCVEEDEYGECTSWEAISSHDYVLKNDSAPSTVYLANSNVQVTFSEFISQMKSCTTTKYDRNGDLLTSACEYPTNTKFDYDEEMSTFLFETDDSDLNTFRIIKFIVSDFAGRDSIEIVIVIDRINPEINFASGRDSNAYIEYATTNNTFDDAYQYRSDLDIYDDQGSVLTIVNHEFYRYAPLLTYKNYEKTQENKFRKLDDYELKDEDKTYYLLINSSVVNDKQCVAYSDSNPSYCYVIDTQNTYYFSELLNYNTYNDIQVWTNIGTDLNPITKIDGNTGVAVYKIAYQVTDYAGNNSNILYKQVFVMDTIMPDINIQDDRENLLFSNVATTNPDNFTGKINGAVTFVATDSPTNISSNAKILFYKCGIQEYSNDPTKCAATYDLLYNPMGTMFGQYNSYAFKRNAANAVYKAFAYDIGQYSYEAELLYKEDTNYTTSAYVLTKNISTVYFVINKANVDVVYTIYGNKFTSDYMNGILSFVESDTNYIEIKDGENSSDVTLLTFSQEAQDYVDASKTNAIGYKGYMSHIESTESGKKVVTVFYKDDKGNVVYEIKYKQADLSKGFMVHESYYYLVGRDAEACVVGKGESNCEKNQELTYVINNVTARIYEDGVYPSLVLKDTYGNTSTVLANSLIVDNTAYTVNADNNRPTGINYWFSVPTSTLTVDNYQNYNELKVPNYNLLINKPNDWEAEYASYYVLDGENYVANTNPEFITRTYYSVDYSIASDVNVLDAKYIGNFNSSNFYAIASYEEAKLYMYNLYYDSVSTQIASGYDFYDAFGHTTYFAPDTPVDTVMTTILQDIYEMIIPTFTADRKFSDPEMRQVVYTGANLTSTMYQYTYLLRTRTVINGAITYTYSFAGDSCSPSANQECIKVNLKVISGVNNTIELAIDTATHTISCVSTGLGWGGTVSNSSCNKPQLVSGQEATIIFIDQDNTNPHHSNVVYFGVRVYSETTDLNYVELGNYIPLENITRYDNDHNVSTYGDYIWINSEWWQLSKIENTNLYKNSCEFKGTTYSSGCVFVTYFSTYEYSMGQYKPAAGGAYYYDYYKAEYLSDKNELVDSVNEYSDKDIEFTYSTGWDICTSQGYSCPLIPVYAKSNTILNLSLKNETGLETSRYLNKKSHIELFNSKNGDISRLFEVITTVKNGKFSEIYSYATLSITINGEMNYYNLNGKIVRVDGYSLINDKPSDWATSYMLFYTFDGNNYIANTSDTWQTGVYYIKDAFACIIDVGVETVNNMSIIDSAGNRVVINFSHTDEVPEIEYSKYDESTNSNVLIGISTESKVTGLSNDYVKIYKYDVIDKEYDLISSNVGNICYSMLTSTTGTLPSSIEFRFNYNADYNCVGAYKLEIVDNFGNSNYKEFVFNPYVINNTFATEEEGFINNIHIYNDVNIIANSFFTIKVNSNLNYVNIYKYPAYSNLTLDEVENSRIDMVTISNFVGINKVDLGTCELSISDKGNGIYMIAAINDASHACDGVYKVEIVDLFSDTITRLSEFAGVEGANELELTLEKPVDWEINYDKYYYLDEEGNYIQVPGSSTTWEENKYYRQIVIKGFAKNIVGGYTIELDSTAPDNALLPGNDQNFNLYLDNSEEADVEDTQELISSQSKTIEYTNTFVTIAWGGYASYSFASLSYRVKAPGDSEFPSTWATISEGVNYTIPFRATYKFAPIVAGVHEYEFKFVDAVGNENGEAIYTIKITINPPDVGLFEVMVNPTTDIPLYDAAGEVIPGRQYEYGERIPTQAILKCMDGLLTKDCTLEQYTYSMVVNGNNYSSYNNNIYALKDPISQDSVFLYGSEDRLKEEIRIELTVSINGKPDIFTKLFVIIDRKAPIITIDGRTAEGTTTYINTVVVSLDSEDLTNIATIYKCDAIEDDVCKTRLPNGSLVDGGQIFDTIDSGEFSYTFDVYKSGYFMIVATDDPINLGNTSKAWFALDNEAPTINVSNGLTSMAPYMYTNIDSVKANVIDELSEINSRVEVSYTALNDADKVYESEMTYDSLLGLTREGKYVLTPIDGVGHIGESITFYIYRQAPKYELSGDSKSVRKDVVLSWSAPENEMIAPIVSVTVDGAMYSAEYNSEDKKYTGELIKSFGEHTFVIVDAAGNRNVIMVTVNNTNNVCINGSMVNVKRHYNYQINSLIIGGKEEGYTYAEDDVIIFALPSQVTGSECVSNGLLGYRTLDPENSYFLVSSGSVANRLNNNQFDFVAQQFISKEAIKEVTNIGGTVIVFVVTKDVANGVLGYSVGTNFFMEDPLGWTMIFMTAILALIPGYRIFVKKKVRVI